MNGWLASVVIWTCLLYGEAAAVFYLGVVGGDVATAGVILAATGVGFLAYVFGVTAWFSRR